jgi:transcriptional regulator with XRE-family HTH domain
MAIQAHIDEPATGQSQRTGTRRALRLKTSGMLPDGQEANVTVHNLSVSGLLLETEVELATGERLTLHLPEAGAVEAAVVWRSERLYGCAFTVPLGAAALAAAQLQGLPVTEASPAVPSARAPKSGNGEALGIRLNRLRREAGLTLADVATRLGVSKPTVWAWEKGKARPLPERINAIAEALGATPDDLAEVTGGQGDFAMLLDDCRTRIAEAYGTSPGAVRIMIEL